MKAVSPIRSSFFLLLLLFPAFTGCRNCELLEIALRSREQDIQVLREEMSHLEYQNQALYREIHAIRQQGVLKVTPEMASQTYTLKRITLGRGTGGIDDDQKEGDEALQVVIEPKDIADDLIKAPGSAEITALEISPEGLKMPISVWKLSAEQLRQSWKQGLFNTGYVLTLPWQQTPMFENVRVLVRFELTDGRPFEADKDIKVRLNPELKRPVMLTPGVSPPVVIPYQPQEVLPIPNTIPSQNAPSGTGPILQPTTSHWRAPSLEGAIRVLQPIPIQPVPLELY